MWTSLMLWYVIKIKLTASILANKACADPLDDGCVDYYRQNLNKIEYDKASDVFVLNVAG